MCFMTIIGEENLRERESFQEREREKEFSKVKH